MPELPEVENVRIGLEKELINNSFLSVSIKEKKIISGNGTKRERSKKKEKEFVESVVNKKIIEVKRRAKNLIIFFDDESIIIIHLKMTGQVIFNGEITKHTHIIFELENGSNLLYNDVRKFGYVLYYKSVAESEAFGHFQKLGLEPFDKNFTLKYFAENIIKKNKSIKSVLLEQSVVVGCGNIYCDEICFASKVIPNRNCRTLNDTEIKDLYKNIIKILSIAIRMGGSSISDYKLVNGDSGKYANNHKVYGKDSTPCIICKNNLQKIIIAGRSTVFCPMCQK